MFFPLLPLAAGALFQEHSIAQISEGPVELLTRERFKRYVEIGRNLRVTYIVACQGLLTLVDLIGKRKRNPEGVFAAAT